MENLKEFEQKLYDKGYSLIGGVDEVGRGPLVGPVVASCVILPKDFELDGLTDSKKLSEKKRELFFDIIKERAISIGIGIVSNEIIDKINILEASKLAMLKAIDNMEIKPEYLLIDGNQKINTLILQQTIIKGDNKSLSIAAASVIAKVTRDRLMYDLDKKYPMYGFKSHKGYPTKAHLKAIEKYGITNDYRKSYGPVKNIIKNT